MATTMSYQLTGRDRAILRAVAAGRCRISTDLGMSLFVDGVRCCEQFIGRRLTNAGLIAIADARSDRAVLTSTGRAALESALDGALEAA